MQYSVSSTPINNNDAMHWYNALKIANGDFSFKIRTGVNLFEKVVQGGSVYYFIIRHVICVYQ